jgi:hypothetical protein
MFWNQTEPRRLAILTVPPGQANLIHPVFRVDLFYVLALWHIRFVSDSGINVISIRLQASPGPTHFPAASDLLNVVWRILPDKTVGTGYLRRSLGEQFAAGPSKFPPAVQPQYFRPVTSSAAGGAGNEVIHLWATFLGPAVGGTQ